MQEGEELKIERQKECEEIAGKELLLRFFPGNPIEHPPVMTATA